VVFSLVAIANDLSQVGHVLGCQPEVACREVVMHRLGAIGGFAPDVGAPGKAHGTIAHAIDHQRMGRMLANGDGRMAHTSDGI